MQKLRALARVTIPSLCKVVLFFWHFNMFNLSILHWNIKLVYEVHLKRKNIGFADSFLSNELNVVHMIM